MAVETWIFQLDVHFHECVYNAYYIVYIVVINMIKSHAQLYEPLHGITLPPPSG